MKKIETFKRLILLGISSVIFLVQVMIYRYYWFDYYSYWVREYLDFWRNGHILIVALYGVLMFFFTSMYGGFKIGFFKNWEVIFSQIFSTLIVNVVTYVQISLMCLKLISGAGLGIFLRMTLIQIASEVILVLLAGLLYKKLFPPRKMILIHGERPIEDILQKFASRKDKYNIVKCMNVAEGYDTLYEEIMSGYDAVVIWDISAEQRNKILKFCYGRRIRIYIMPKITDVILTGSQQLHLFDTPILLTREYEMSMEQRFFKRFIDLFCATVLCIVTSPIMLVTAIVIKLYDGGPVLYKQVRCTRDMKEFWILKFRSMRVDAEKDGVARLASKGDCRITPIGKFIRKVRIDELPQLFNIIRGDMSFIGPRPERPEIIKEYLDVMPEFAFRTKVKAGLAGYAQVYGKYNTAPYDKLKLDLFYIEHYTVWLDIKLMLLTLKILFTPDSTEGVEMSQITALKDGGKKE